MTPLPLDFILLVCAAVLLLLVVAVVAWLVHRASASTEAETAPTAPVVVEEAPQARFAGGEMAADLRSALKLLRPRLRAREAQYERPWFLLIGPASSGKSALLEQSALTANVLEQVEVQNGNGLTWTVLDTGVVLEVHGDWSFERTPRIAGTWARLLHAIGRERPARPLDGIVVALAATDFAGPDALSVTELAEEANFLHARLRQVQIETGLNLPVYVTLTQCDRIAGFAAFAQGLSDEERRGMLGWSNPFSAELQFHGEWVDVALAQIRSAIDTRLARIFTVEDYSRDHDALFLLTNSLADMQPRLKPFLARALRPAPEVPAPLFRGLFLTGQSDPAEEEVEHGAADPVAVSLPEPQVSYAWGSLGLGGRRGEEAPVEPVTWSAGPPVHFVADLWLRKIFAERSLALPLARGYHVRQRTEHTLQAVSAVLLLVCTVGLAVGYVHLSRTAARLTPLLASISADFQGRAANEVSVNGMDSTIRTPTDDLLRVMLELRQAGLQGVFYPWSWGRSLEHRAGRALTPAVRMLILDRFERQLEARAGLWTDPRQIGGDAVLAGSLSQSTLTGRSAELLPEFQRQRAFAEGMVALQQHLDLYAQLRAPGSAGRLQAVAELDGFLNDRAAVVLPDDATSPILDAALQQTSWMPFQYRARDLDNARLKQTGLATALFAAAIEQNRLRRAADALGEALRRVQGPRPAYDDIRAAQQAYDTLSAALADRQLGWVGAPEFRLPANLAAVTVDPLGKSNYLPANLRPETEAEAQESYQQMLNALLGARSALTGPLLQIREGRVSLTERAQEVQLGLDNLLNLSFMGSGGGLAVGAGSATSAGSMVSLPRPAGLRSSAAGVQGFGGSITWSKPALDAAAALPAGLQHYLSEDLEQAPPELQASLGRIAKDRIGTTLEAAVAGAESPGPRLPAQPQLEVDVQPAVQAFTAVAPSLRSVLEAMRSLGLTGPLARLQNVTSRQALTLLEGLDRAFQANALYSVPGPSVDRWTGAVSPAGAFFAAPTADDLAEYLSTERERVRAYSTVAQPLLDFLAATNGTGSTTYRRWRAIDTALRQYDAKRPGSSLRLLETYLAGDFDKVRLGACGEGARSPFPASAADYFVGVYFTVRDELLARCAVLSGAEQGSAFSVLAERFNRLLAGHFPFAPGSAGSLSEADPQDVAAVFALYEANAATLGSTTNPAQRAFLAQLAQLRPFFDALRSGSGSSIEFVPRFRVARDRESSGDQIAEWTLQVGSDDAGSTVLRSGEPERRATWTVGQPVTLTLRWAKNAPFVPVSASTANVRSGSAGVTYRFSDPWALLRLVATFAAPAIEQDPLRPDGGLLLFHIPEQGVANLSNLQPRAIAEAKVFAQIGVFVPGKPDSVAMPRFPLPAEAPTGAVLSRNSHGGTAKGLAR